MTRRIQELFDLTGQTALITGGSRGLGLQMAHALGEAGARLMLSSRKAEDLSEAVSELKAAGFDADYIAADCSKEEDTRQCSGLFHFVPRSGQAVHDPESKRTHSECCLHRGFGR